MKRVSIIIVTYNSEKDIYDCVDSIKAHADIPIEEIELIVVDNNSRNPQPMFDRLRQQWGYDVRLIKNFNNSGYGQGNNIGIRQATASIVLIMNPDVRLMDPFFSRPLKAFDADNRLIMYGMKQMYSLEKESRSSFCCTYMMNGYMRTILEGFCNRLEWYWPKIHYFSGSCFFVRKSCFEDVGLFDESVFMYGEEDDIHYRLMKCFGAYFKYDKKIRYIHLISERPPSVEYEMNFVHVAMLSNAKKGYNEYNTLLNMQRLYRVLFWREKIRILCGKNDHRRYDMLAMMLDNIDKLRREL